MADLPEKPIRLVQLHSKSHEGITPVRLGELDEDLEETLESFALDDEPIAVRKISRATHPSEFEKQENEITYAASQCTEYEARAEDETARLVHVDTHRKMPWPIGQDVHTLAFHGDHALCERMADELKTYYDGKRYLSVGVSTFITFLQDPHCTFRQGMDYAAAALCLEIAKGPYMSADRFCALIQIFTSETSTYRRMGKMAPDIWRDARARFPKDTPEAMGLRIGTFIVGSYVEDLKRAGRFFRDSIIGPKKP